MTRLFIAEKPSLGRAIAAGLGKGKTQEGYIACGTDIVTWCFGHILEQAMPEEYDEKYKSWRISDLPIMPVAWKLHVSKAAAKQFAIIKKLVKEADEIVNGGDPDREGQLLVDEVLEYLGNKKPVRRILLNALDDKSVKNALSDLRDNRDFIGLKNSALARSRADWLIGMNLTRAYTIRMREAGYAGVASVGRVQTPTMALVVRRENEIKDFHPIQHFSVQVDWHHLDGEISSVWQPQEDIDCLDGENRLLDKSMAEALLQKLQSIQNLSGQITKLEQVEKKEQPPLPYSLSSLQIDAGKKFGLSPQQVLDTMQSLYEKKLTTYPRSDCDYLPENQTADIDVILENLKGLSGDFSQMVKGLDTSLRSKAWNDKKISAHHAIIPTREEANFSTLSDMEQKLYRMVAIAYIAQFYPAHVYLATKIEISYEGELFITKGKTVQLMGWRSLYSSDSSEEDEEVQKALPVVQEGDHVTYMDGKVISKETKPPARFTPASLLEAMKKIYKYVKDKSLQPLLKECHGIGTEATRAGIIETLQKRGYLSLEKKHLVPCDKAYHLSEVLSDDILYPDTTALWEKELDAIRDGMPMDDFFAKQASYIGTLLEKVKTIQFSTCNLAVQEFTEAAKIATCPKCGKPLRLIRGKNGSFWGCEDRERCNATFSDCNGVPAIFKCPTCKNEYLHRWASKQKKGVFYWVCGDRNCKTFLLDKNGKPTIDL